MDFSRTYVCFTIAEYDGYTDLWWENGGAELWQRLTGDKDCKCAFMSNAQAFCFVERAKEIPFWDAEPFEIEQSDDRSEFWDSAKWIPGLRDLRPIQRV